MRIVTAGYETYMCEVCSSRCGAACLQVDTDDSSLRTLEPAPIAPLRASPKQELAQLSASLCAPAGGAAGQQCLGSPSPGQSPRGGPSAELGPGAAGQRLTVDRRWVLVGSAAQSTAPIAEAGTEDESEAKVVLLASKQQLDWEVLRLIQDRPTALMALLRGRSEAGKRACVLQMFTAGSKALAAMEAFYTGQPTDVFPTPTQCAAMLEPYYAEKENQHSFSSEDSECDSESDSECDSE